MGLDHFALAKQTGELLRKAVIQCEDQTGGEYRSDLPKLFLGHSLGCKLQTISMAATGIDNDLNGVGYLCFNNFGFTDTLGMARSFAKEFQKSQPSVTAGFGIDPEVFNNMFNFAEQAIGMAGVEFTHSLNDTNRIISNKYLDQLQAKTRLFVFHEDELDNSLDFIQACPPPGNKTDQSKSVSVSGLQGTHLIPVYLKIDRHR